MNNSDDVRTTDLAITEKEIFLLENPGDESSCKIYDSASSPPKKMILCQSLQKLKNIKWIFLISMVPYLNHLNLCECPSAR